MYESLPTDLERLDTLERWHQLCLREIQSAKAIARQKAEETKRREERQPLPPDWVMQLGIGAGQPPVALHVGGCHLAAKRSRGITRDQALRALADQIPACTLCRPDTDLGYLG